jgi:DNA-binding transcriptional ArsR family regulator
MAQAKTETFDPTLVRTACLAKALSHPVRIRILEILAARKGCVCGGLVELLPLAQSTVSQHLQELRDAGLIRGDVDGARTCYCLNPKVVAEAGAAFADIFRRICGSAGEVTKGPPSGACALPKRRMERSGKRSFAQVRTSDKTRKP